jgi:ribose 1,5-bisphosphokinase
VPTHERFVTAARHALYFAPRAGTPWARFGNEALTGDARRYGFHATLKAPFRLANGATLAELAAKLDALCRELEAFTLPRPCVALLEDFLALVPMHPDARLDAIAATCVTAFDRFRAPLDEREMARRRAVTLSTRQEALLARWGYPFVLEEFRFHMSLTGRLAGARAPQIPALPADPLWFDSICIFEEAAPGEQFRTVHRSPFATRGRLLYVVGPSGAGKDTLLSWVRKRLPDDAAVAFAHRVETREVGAAQFEASLAAGRFAMHWRANGHAYGIGNEIHDWLARGRTVIVNGSRGYLPQALADFPRLEVVHVVAGAETLQRRLVTRGRESSSEIAGRLKRSPKLRLLPATRCTEIHNDADIGAAGRSFLALLA